MHVWEFIDLRESSLAADVRFLVIWLAFARFSDSIVFARRVSNALLTQRRLDRRSRGTGCGEEIGQIVLRGYELFMFQYMRRCCPTGKVTLVSTVARFLALQILWNQFTNDNGYSRLSYRIDRYYDTCYYIFLYFTPVCVSHTRIMIHDTLLYYYYSTVIPNPLKNFSFDSAMIAKYQNWMDL